MNFSGQILTMKNFADKLDNIKDRIDGITMCAGWLQDQITAQNTQQPIVPHAANGHCLVNQLLEAVERLENELKQ